VYKPRPIEVAIEIPSGQIVFSDDLRFAYPVPDEKGMPQNVHGPLWQKVITEAYAEAGLFHGYVGNSCPSIHRYNGKLLIGNQSYDRRTYGSRHDLPGTDIGSVCTDLWWYSIADKDDLFRRIYEAGEDPEKYRFDGIAKVKPGRYVLKHYWPHFGKPRIKHGEAELFATLELSDKEITPFRLPDEGVADALASAFKSLHYVCVEYDKDHLDDINGDPSLIFEYYQLMLHWKTPETGSFFTEPKFTGEELLDYALVHKRVENSFTEGFNKTRKQREETAILKKKLDAMTPEELAAHDKKIAKVAREIFEEIRAEEKMLAEIKAKENSGG